MPVARRISSLLRSLFADPIARCLFALTLFVPSLSALTLVAYADNYLNGGITYGAPSQPVEHTEGSQLGVNTFLEKEVDPQNITRTFQMLRDGGFHYIRQGFAWNDIEISGKGDFADTRNPGHIVSSWEKYDRVVDLAQSYGIEIIARLDSPPVWARMPGDDVDEFRKGPPAKNSDYADFVSAVVSRYKGKIKYFQIWNEPNLYGEWGGHAVSPKEYTDLLHAAHDAAKKANPDAVIVSAALAPTAEDSLKNLSDVLFLEGMYHEGAAPYFDIMSTMIYGLGYPPTDRRTDLKRLNFSRPILLHEVMTRNGDVRKPIWISEYAWLSLPAGWEEQRNSAPDKKVWGENTWGQSVDEATQARWEVEGIERARREWPWLGVINVWYFREPDPNPKQPANFFAIVRPDFTPRPAYTALKEHSAEFSSARVPAVKSLPNALGFPLLYGLFGLLTLSSGALWASGLVRWTGAVMAVPRGRYSEAVQERARNGAVVLGMALLVGLYYKTDSIPFMVACLGAWWVLAFLKPSTGLAAVVFTIPFFWYQKDIGRQHYPLSETLLLLVFASVLARRGLAYFLPDVARRLAITEYRSGSSEYVEQKGAVAASLWAPFSDGSYVQPLPSTNGLGSFAAMLPPKTLPAGVSHQVHVPQVKREPFTVPLSQEVEELAQAASTMQPAANAARSPSYSPNEVLIRSEQPTEQVNVLIGATSLSGIGDALPQSRAPATYLKAIQARFREWNRNDPFAPPAVAMLLVGALSLFTLADPAFARDSARAYRWVIIEPVLFYFLLADVIRSRKGLLRICDFFVAAAVPVALLGLWQYARGTGTITTEGVSRVIGTYMHANNLAFYLGRVITLGSCMTLFLPWSPRKWLYGLAMLPIAVTFFLTYSRGGYVAVAIALLLAVGLGLRVRQRTRHERFKPSRRALAILAGGVLALSFAAGLAWSLLPRLPERISSLGSSSLRVLIWGQSLAMLRDHPIFGVGPDQFLNQFQGRYFISALTLESDTAHPHNLVLDYWLSLGIMGVFILTWLMLRFGREAMSRVRAATRGLDPVGKAIALGLIAFMTDFLVHGLVDNSYFLMDLALMFWLSCGLLQLLRRV
ncbi:MAG: O-antigen ligase family protein [Chloroflexota bacterium]|nr:O-antigen ligase family protein [Chloroflexota bacterium]